MKRVFYCLFLLALIVGFSACEEDEVAKKLTVSITVKYPDGFEKTVAEGILVEASGVNSSAKESAMTNASGVATLELQAGQYNFTCKTESDEFAFNGLLENAGVTADAKFDIKLQAVCLEGGLVFKEIYYTGCKTPGNKPYFADQFHEIYNNSDEVIYLDGLCLGVMQQSSSKKNVWVDDNGQILPRLPLQFYVWYIPGSGKEHPLQPRTSCIIAQDGIDHHSDPEGNPNSSVNLSNADWETYCGDINKGKDADAAGVPNLSMMFTTITTMKDWLHSVFGAGVIMFRLPEGTDPKQWAADPGNLATKPSSTNKTKYLMVPKEYVVDAVEVVSVEEEKQYKRLPQELDAGKVWCDGTYISKSIRRKVKQIIDGKVIYQDTNNSSDDFLSNLDPTPGVHPTSVEK
ncbi:DUF4876 domain-containing protein [Marinilabiliaceae bacterium JC017]|nr:DUF4876 domain-containing protein [Marinilabiliaceae bacterium JC017]